MNVGRPPRRSREELYGNLPVLEETVIEPDKWIFLYDYSAGEMAFFGAFRAFGEQAVHH